jgi:hypothetical protein
MRAKDRAGKSSASDRGAQQSDAPDVSDDDLNRFLAEAFAQYENAVNVNGFHSINAV